MTQPEPDEIPEQTDNRERPEDGDQSTVSQDSQVDYGLEDE